MSTAFDILVALGGLACAGIALVAGNRIGSVAAFVIMGFFVALAWVRLGAPDVALAEAAIGAGLTGALLLRSANRLGPVREAGVPIAVHGIAACLSLALAGGIVWAFATGTAEAVYPSLVAARVGESGVSNPVTAVLLNFRAWDTLLEVAVLVVALLLVSGLAPVRIAPAPPSELVLPFLRIVVPVAVLLAGHLLWKGATAPGGAFQAAALLTGGGLALALCGLLGAGRRTGHVLVLAGLGGLALFLAAALGAAILTGGLLDYPAGSAKVWIIAIESALTLSIAAMLVSLFLGPSEGVRDDR